MIAFTWDNEARPKGAGNTLRPLTHSSDLSREGLPMNGTRTCSVDGCDTAKIEARGWCKKHYRRWQKHGDPNWQPPTPPAVCTIDGCDKPVIARGWCTAHWTRWKRHGDPLGGGIQRQPMPEKCIAEDCPNPPRARGMCAIHWRRDMAEQDPEWGEGFRAKRREWHASNPERIADYRRRSRARHLEATLARVTAWREANPDRVMVNNWQQRRRKYGLSEDVIDVVHPDVIWERDGGVCQICGDDVDPDLPAVDRMSATVDHIVPVRDPASEHSYANTQLAHLDCNLRKFHEGA